MRKRKKRKSDASGGDCSTLQSVSSSRRRGRASTAAFRACAVALTLAAFLLLFDSAPLMARKKKLPTTKTVIGQVFDASDNGIAGAAVEMKDLTTGKTLAIYAGPHGHYTFTGLSLAQDYQFRAHYKGKSSEVRKVSSWDTRIHLVINLHIPAPKD